MQKATQSMEQVSQYTNLVIYHFVSDCIRKFDACFNNLMSVPFQALDPSIPRDVDVPYAAMALVCSDCTDCSDADNTDSSDVTDIVI